MLILASSSPQRVRLLSELGVEFTQQPSQFDERSVRLADFSNLEQYVEDIAAGKIMAVAQTQTDPTTIVIGGDLLAFWNDQEFGKPRDLAQAEHMMRQLMGQTHQEIAAVGIWTAADGLHLEHQVSEVFVPELSDALLAEYLSLADPLNKAAAFSLHTLQRLLKEQHALQQCRVMGDVTTVIGLPVVTAARLLQSVGVEVPQDPTVLEAQWRRDILGA